jgi:hypothetical protein
MAASGKVMISGDHVKGRRCSDLFCHILGSLTRTLPNELSQPYGKGSLNLSQPNCRLYGLTFEAFELSINGSECHFGRVAISRYIADLPLC